MIHFLCPCCKVSRLPHANECTFRKDWPEGCADFDYIANLRSGLEAALAEVERHKMTSEERNAATVAAAVASPPAPFPSASVQYDDGRRVPVSVYAESLRGYLDRTKEGE